MILPVARVASALKATVDVVAAGVGVAWRVVALVDIGTAVSTDKNVTSWA